MQIFIMIVPVAEQTNIQKAVSKLMTRTKTHKKRKMLNYQHLYQQIVIVITITIIVKISNQ